MAVPIRVVILVGAAVALHTPPTRSRASPRRTTALSYADTDAVNSSDRIDAQQRAVDALQQRAVDALQQRAVDSLRQKGDTAAVKALQADVEADVEDIVVLIDGVDVDVTEYAREHPGGAARVLSGVFCNVDVDTVDQDHDVLDVGLDVGLERFYRSRVTLLAQRIDGSLLQRVDSALLQRVDGALLRIDAIRRIHGIGVCVAKRCGSPRRGSRTRRRRVERDRRPH